MQLSAVQDNDWRVAGIASEAASIAGLVSIVAGTPIGVRIAAQPSAVAELVRNMPTGRREVTVADVKVAAEINEIPWPAIVRARQRLGAMSKRSWVWRLPSPTVAI